MDIRRILKRLENAQQLVIDSVEADSEQKLLHLEKVRAELHKALDMIEVRMFKLRVELEPSRSAERCGITPAAGSGAAKRARTI